MSQRQEKTVVISDSEGEIKMNKKEYSVFKKMFQIHLGLKLREIRKAAGHTLEGIQEDNPRISSGALSYWENAKVNARIFELMEYLSFLKADLSIVKEAQEMAISEYKATRARRTLQDSE